MPGIASIGRVLTLGVTSRFNCRQSFGSAGVKKRSPLVGAGGGDQAGTLSESSGARRSEGPAGSPPASMTPATKVEITKGMTHRKKEGCHDDRQGSSRARRRVLTTKRLTSRKRRQERRESPARAKSGQTGWPAHRRGGRAFHPFIAMGSMREGRSKRQVRPRLFDVKNHDEGCRAAKQPSLFTRLVRAGF